MSSVNDIFSKICERQIGGIMLHEQLADYFDFLGHSGFMQEQEYRYLVESLKLRDTRRYFIKHYNLLTNKLNVGAKGYIPSAWYGFDRREVIASAKKNAVKYCFNTWYDWELESKKIYETCYYELNELRDLSSALFVKGLVNGVNSELEEIDSVRLKLGDIEYNLSDVNMTQCGNEHKKYKKFVERVRDL